MATTERDYYEVLGVSRAADDGDIKRAFRRLAREVHPDVSAEPDAAERFREIVEGKHDDLPEQAFYMVGTIDDAIEKARKMAA